ncbi:MAG: hypothetical protein HOI15_18005, partial [Opitutales bacterium]|nr:hypothetical protein [Opitutales bacterium]
LNIKKRIILCYDGTWNWKDGNLDACGIRGWDTSGKKGAWKKGKPFVFDKVRKRLINAAKKNRLNLKGDWFELVVSVDGKRFDRLKFQRTRLMLALLLTTRLPRRVNLCLLRMI